MKSRLAQNLCAAILFVGALEFIVFAAGCSNQVKINFRHPDEDAAEELEPDASLELEQSGEAEYEENDELNELCANVWHDGLPAIYPSSFYGDKAHDEAAVKQLSDFIAELGLNDPNLYSFAWRDVVRTLSLGPFYASAPVIPVEDKALPKNYIAWFEKTIEKYPALFSSGPFIGKEVGYRNLTSAAAFYMEQDYCGKSFADAAGALGNTLTGYVSLTVKNSSGEMINMTGAALPMLPLPKTPAFSVEKAAEVFLSAEYKIFCADGEHVYQAEDASSVSVFPDTFVYAKLIEDDPMRIDYRLVYKAAVTPKEGFCTWTAYVDAVDGTFLGQYPNCICD